MAWPVPAGLRSGRARRWPTFTHGVISQAAYVRPVTVPLMRAGQSVVSGAGFAQVRIGPSGVGAKWYPMTATFSTTSGPADSSIVVLYNGFVADANLLNGQGYSGGGDTAGLAIPQMTPGDVIVAEWVNATPGDVAQLTIVGTQDALAVP
jgi:hypothetical protein